MKYKKKRKSPLKKIQSIYNVGDGDEEMNLNLARLSGQKGAEKKSKDKVGRSLNRGDPSKVFDRLEKRIHSRKSE